MKKVIVPLIVAGVLGLGAATTVYSLIGKKSAPITVVAAKAKMVVAKRSIMPGQAIVDDDLSTVTVGSKNSPQGIFGAASDVVGRVALMPISEGQPVLVNLLADPHAGAGLQALLPDGTRAITLQVDEITGVGGLLLPGCHVDLLTSLHAGSTDSLMTRTLVQDVKVIAVGQAMATPSADGGIPRSVTLVVSPRQAETIELASNVGRPRLVLRSGTDHSIISTPGVSLSELNTNKPQAALADSTGGNRSVEIIRAGVESTVTFPDTLGAAKSKAATSVAGGKSDTGAIGSR